MSDLISFNNTLDLDSGNSQDSVTYFGIDYSLAFTLEFKQKGPVVFLKFERNGLYDYDAPLFIEDELIVAGPSRVEAYRNKELLPQIEEFWVDLPVAYTPLRFKAGLFAYEVGKGFAQGTGSFENYGLNLTFPGEDFSWRLHYFRPDLAYKTRLGPTIKQEKQEGIGYEHNAANYFAFDAAFSSDGNNFSPFIGLLLDNTSSGKRANLFAAPVHREVLGTLGFDWDIKIKDFSLGFEAARNFGKAKSEDDGFKDIEHKGYLLYATASYNIAKLSPRCQFVYSSGNKVTTEMVDNGDEQFVGGANKAFSAYSPLNTNLMDSLCPVPDSLPLVFSGWGYGMNYGLGLNRPSTLADDCILENLIMPSIGFDYRFSDKFSATLDWWYILANEKGVGAWEGVAKELSRNLGQEIDLSFSYDINKQINISLYTGYFVPGEYFKEERDDTEGSLFTPFVRGDGNADPAYQIELVAEFKF
ncbi:MAG: hypothetical protein A3K83_05605 [Omnitrophica WOR_2 bacterium RBG_13_44_8b]|nr:MAG: hypothetical protein A3K83_05605 [Omnitrophica WOR_2 bacterium RBG_13_44_8b]